MRCCLSQIILSCMLLAGGCTGLSPLGQSSSDSTGGTLAKMPNTGPLNARDEKEKNQPHRPTQMRREIKVVRLQIDSVELPAGTARKLEKLWTYLDEEPVSLHSTVLGMNGFRVGVGRNSDWPEVESLLSRQGGLSFQKKIIETRLGYPVHLEMASDLPIQDIFIFSDEQTLRGQHFPPGDNILTVSTFVDEETGEDVIIAAAPQIRTSTRHFNIETDNGDPKIVYKSQFYTFDEMMFRVKMPIEDFLVIGPGSQAARDSSVAHHFLTQTRDGMDYDRIFIIRPKVIRVPVKPTPTGAGNE